MALSKSNGLDSNAKPEKIDRRIIRTRKAIDAALDKLIAKQDASKITVSAIAREADIDRKTFYLHYSSIDDLFAVRAQETVEHVLNIIASHREGTRQQRIHDALQDVNDELTGNLTYYENIARSMSYDDLMSRLASSIRPALKRADIEEKLERDDSAVVRMGFYLSGALTLYRNWVLSDHKVSVEVISNTLEETLNTDLFPLIVLLGEAQPA